MAGLVRLIQIAMLVSIVLYVVVGELVGRTGTANNGLFYGMSLASLSTLGAAVVVRRTLVLPTEALLQQKPTDPLVQARWRTGHLVDAEHKGCN